VCALHFNGTEKNKSDRLEDKTTTECISYSTMNPFPSQCIEIRGQCGHKRLPLARLHLRNAPIMQHGTTNYLRQIHQPRNRNPTIRTNPCIRKSTLCSAGEAGYLHIKMPHPKRPPRRLPHHGKCLCDTEGSAMPIRPQPTQMKCGNSAMGSKKR
jgi:hypothetical protein